MRVRPARAAREALDKDFSTSQQAFAAEHELLECPPGPVSCRAEPGDDFGASFSVSVVRTTGPFSAAVSGDGIVLRPASAEDALCLSVLAMQVFLDTYATKGIRPAIAREVRAGYSEPVFAQAIASDSTRLSVAESSGHLVGFAQVTLGATQRLVPAGPQSELLRLYVQEPFTGRGIGTRLLAEAERLAAAAGSRWLWLTPWVGNHRALGFYDRRGYQDLGLTHFSFEGETHENRVCARSLAAVAPAA